MKPLLALAVLLIAPVALGAVPTATTATDAMHKAAFLVGHWQGQGWIVTGRDHARHTFTETETIAPKLDGALLLIEGSGHNAQGKSIHAALAVMTWDAHKHVYRWQAWSDGARYIDTTAQVGAKQLTWGFKVPHAGNIRFTIRLDSQGRWVETGEISQDGTHWAPFFGMTLTRLAAPPGN